MKKLIYIHGLGSSALSGTGLYLKEHLKDYNVLLPEIPLDPYKACNYIKELLWQEKPDIAVGSSLGGYYLMSTETWGNKKILINPAMHPGFDIEHNIGLGRHDFLKPRADGEKEYVIDKEFIDKLNRLEDNFYNIAYEDYNYCNTYALFGTQDELFSHIDDFKKWFDETKMITVPCSHRLSDTEMPILIKFINDVAEGRYDNN